MRLASLLAFCFLSQFLFGVQSFVLLSFPLRSSSPIFAESSDYEAEETLLCIDLDVKPGTDVSQAEDAVSKYCRSFPFAAVLPVQPLQYLPGNDGGVEVKFLRKKTDIKSGVDGGIRFFLNTFNDEEEEEPPTIEITAKRNSSGQVIAKLMAEKLVIKSFVDGISGKEDGRFGKAPTDLVSVKSLYHKWM